jgi:hypothetical protein
VKSIFVFQKKLRLHYKKALHSIDEGSNCN